MEVTNGTFNIPDIPLGLIPISAEQTVFRYMFATTSFFLNSIVIIVICFSRQLHLPRHAFWAGISFVILFCTVQWLADLYLGQVKNTYHFCAVYELNLGLWYPTLLLYLSLAGFDRYLAIKYYEWYKRRMNNKNAVSAMVIAWVFNALIVDSPYWTRHKTLDKCTANATHMHWLFAWNVLIGIVNMVLQTKIFVESRKAIRAYLANPTAGNFQRYLFRDPQVFTISIELRCYGPSRREGRSPDVRVLSMSTGPAEAVDADIVHQINPDATESGQTYSIQCFPMGRARIDRLDFRAALILSANVVPFWLFTFPLAFYTMAFYWCARFRFNCSMESLSHADPYVKALFFVPCIYMPSMYMWNSSEFVRAFRHLCRRVEPNSANRSSRREMMT